MTKVAVPVGTAVAAGAVFSFLFRWYESPLTRVYGRFDSFDIEGTVPIAYVLFAFGLALAVGVVWRRSAPAMVVGFGAYVACRIPFDSWARQRLVTPLTATWGPGTNGPKLDTAWILFQGPSDRTGRLFTGNSTVLESCSREVGNGVKGLDPHCLMRHGAGYNHAVYDPSSRFWEFQGIESALFVGAALVLIALAVLVLRRRAA